MSLINDQTKIKVSSTQDKSTPRKALIDRDAGTCWTSTQGLPQWIQLSFQTPIIPEKLSATFQGGFVATRVAVFMGSDSTTESGKKEIVWTKLKDVYPEDINRRQEFDLVAGSDEGAAEASHLKLLLEESSDFFGRITVYDLDVQGGTVSV